MLRRFIVAPVAFLLIAQPAAAQLLLTGVGAGGAGGSAPAVTLDTSLGVFVNNDSGIGTTAAIDGGLSTKQWTWAGWFWGSDNTSSTAGNFNTLDGPSIVRGTQQRACEVKTGPPTSDGFCIAVDNSPALVQTTMADTTGSDATHSVNIAGSGSASAWVRGKWNFMYISCDTTSGVQACSMSINGQDALATGIFSTPTITADLQFRMFTAEGLPDGGGFNAQGLGFMNFNVTNLGAIHQGPFIMSNVSTACTGVGAPYADCPAKNRVSPTILAKFWTNTGNPYTANGGAAVDWGTNCALPLGAQPKVCYRGDGTAFLTNQGSATSGDLSAQSNVSGGFLGPAPYGPSGITAHRVTQRWAQGHNGGGAASMVTNATGFPISTGDLLVIEFEFSDSSTTVDHLPFTCASANSTWTFFAGLKDSGHAIWTGACYAFAGAGETGAVTLTPSNGASTRTSQWAMFDYVNVASVETPPSARQNASGATGSTPVYATLNANVTCLSAIFNSNGATHAFTAPTYAAAATATGYRWKTLHSGSLALVYAWDQFFPTIGSATAATIGVSANDTTVSNTLCMVPN